MPKLMRNGSEIDSGIIINTLSVEDSYDAGAADVISSVATELTEQGVNTSATADLSTVLDNIDTLATNKYNTGYNAGVSTGSSSAAVGNASAADVLKGCTFSNSSASGLTGTMPNKGAVSGTITTSGGTYTIPEGYHNGSGKVTGPTRAALIGTNVNLTTNAYLLEEYTAYGKNGTKYTGSMPNKGAVTKTITPSTSKQTYTIPKGYHNGEGVVTVSAFTSSIKTKTYTIDIGAAGGDGIITETIDISDDGFSAIKSAGVTKMTNSDGTNAACGISINSCTATTSKITLKYGGQKSQGGTSTATIVVVGY